MKETKENKKEVIKIEGKDFKEDSLDEEMVKGKKKVTTKRKKSSSAGYKKAKKAISNLKRYRP